MLRGLGFTNLPDQSQMAAITFSDVVVSHVPFDNDLLFHELVHVEQHRQLGIETFSDLYVRGFLNGGGYEGIPLERNAYLLGDRYAQNRSGSFAVADEVATWIAGERFEPPLRRLRRSSGANRPVSLTPSERHRYGASPAMRPKNEHPHPLENTHTAMRIRAVLVALTTGSSRRATGHVDLGVLQRTRTLAQN
jgi:hypothetical protein